MNARRLLLVIVVASGGVTSPMALDATCALAAAPVVSEESSSNIDSTSATVSAQIDAEGSPTTYHVEYGRSKVDESSTSEASAGASEGVVDVSAQLGRLQPGAEYHFRFVATNALSETATGGEANFATNTSTDASASILPDERAYELVSPPGELGEVYYDSQPAYGRGESDAYADEMSFQASTDGDAVAYVADPSASGGNGDRGQGLGNQWLARRTGSGWEASDVTPAGAGESALESAETEYVGFSSDLSVGIFTAESSSLALTAQPQGPASCRGENNRVLYSHGSDDGALHALFTKTKTLGDCGSPLFAGASVDDSQLFFQTEGQLTPEAPEVAGSKPSEREVCEENCDLYDSTDGQLSLVNVLPEGKLAAGATFGAAPAQPAEAHKSSPVLGNAVSSDGSRVFWTDTQPGVDMEHVFVRENSDQPESPLGVNGECTVPADACTIAVSVGAARYWTATPNGRYAFYIEGGRLWRFDAEDGVRENLVGEDAGVQGVIGTSEDGSYVYFMAEGALTEDAESHLCEVECNLYFLHVGEAPKLVAVLGGGDDDETRQESFANGTFTAGDWQPALGARTAEVAPDGRSVVFESGEHLTGYDSSALSVEQRLANGTEVFIYEAGAGRVFCVSCSPSGAPPASEAGVGTTLLEIQETEGHGSYLPIHASLFDGGETSMPHWISADGSRVFFDTSQPLVSQDTNGLQDVYEWEREGAASCPTRAPARLDGGCIFLLSGGESADFSYLIDASVSGNDVFFSTRAQLVPRDANTKVDVYDARVNGGFPEFSLACTGSGCQGVPPAPPIFATPSSVTFGGVGNFEAPRKAVVKPKAKPKACKKGFTRKRGRCVKKKATKAGKRSKRGRK